jgi:gluconate 2-dehydrogenase gamma chain
MSPAFAHEEVFMSEEAKENGQIISSSPFSRRSFIKGSGVAIGTAGVGALALNGVAPVDAQSATPAASPTAGMGEMLDPGKTPLTFFDMHEADTVDAFASRILPGTADDPGAHEAGVVNYIDRVLGGPNLGIDLKTYTLGPFLVVSDVPETVEASSARDPYVSIPVASSDAARYGYQSVLTPQQIYRRGIGFLDAYTQSKFQKDFIDLDTDSQDSVISDMVAGKTTGFNGPSDQALFGQLRNDTIEGMFSDPMYSGNAGLVGWKLIGYPGAQRNYTPDEVTSGKTTKQPQSLMQMMAAEESA